MIHMFNHRTGEAGKRNAITSPTGRWALPFPGKETMVQSQGNSSVTHMGGTGWGGVVFGVWGGGGVEEVGGGGVV